MDYKDGTPNGGVGIWVWSMATGGKDQTRKIQIKRERQKRQESKLAAKTEWRRGGRGRISSGQKVIKDSKSDEKRRKSVAEVVFC